ncbi:type II toxin-antitoxin system VapC family toxin [Corynebacterium sp. USCH3]|uniref:type II toxin-antitoxin system VapC family toxin n=1 Tax=Corynebacterium sp. USCH3 TaxID=3024840 RepID=UPI0030A88A09
MKYLLDTNVVSELRKRPGVADGNVVSWAEKLNAGDAAISVITVMEIELGIARVDRRDPTQGMLLRQWLNNSVLPGFENLILPVTLDVVRTCVPYHVPDPRPERDAFIAATAQVHGLTVATRNVRDFADIPIPVVNPWKG